MGYVDGYPRPSKTRHVWPRRPRHPFNPRRAKKNRNSPIIMDLAVRKSNSSCHTTDAMRRVESRFSFKSSPGVSPQDLNFHRNGTQSPRFARRRYQRLWVVVRIHQPSSKAQSCHCRYFCCQKGQSCINAVGRLLL